MVNAPRLVVSLPARTAADARAEAREAADAGADLAEVRLDRWDPLERERAAALFPSPLALLATLRSRAEGGEGPDDPAERAAALRALADLPFEGLDLEAARDLALLPTLPTHLAVRIVSSHLRPGTAESDVVGTLRSALGGEAIRKVVVPASVGTFLRVLLPRIPPSGDGARLLLTTGASGALCRAWAARLEYPIVFTSLPERPGGATRPTVEPSQIPVDRLRWFLSGGREAPLFGILGRPVAHSQSPYLHARWMERSAHPGLYVPIEIESESEFVDALPALAAGGFRGLNVTHPWKPVALAVASRVTRAAETCAVANLLTFREGEIEADNTDLIAILRRLGELRSSDDWDGGELAVVGAGGAAAATLAAARELGARAGVIARDTARAAPVAAQFGAELLDPARPRPFPLLVHATPVGRPDDADLGVAIAPWIDERSRLIDWVYTPAHPVLRETAQRRGAAYEDGWRLLVYQAAASFGIWWGEEPDEAEVAATIEEGPCAVSA